MLIECTSPNAALPAIVRPRMDGWRGVARRMRQRGALVETVPTFAEQIESASQDLSPLGRREFGRVISGEALSALFQTAETPTEASTIALRQVAQHMSAATTPEQHKAVTQAVAEAMPAASKHLKNMMSEAGGTGAALIAMIYTLAHVIQSADTAPATSRLQ